MNKCTHCLKRLNNANKTRDHIFPKSWFPKNTPPTLSRWTVPCCNICNLKYQMIEDDLFVRWGIGINPEDYSVEGISEKALNNISLESVNDEKRFRRKLKAIESIIHDFRMYDPQNPQMKTLKGMTPLPGIRSHLAIRLPRENLYGFSEKVIKGLEYKLRKKLVTKNRKIITYYVHEKDEEMEKHYSIWKQLIATNEHNINLGPAFMVKYGIDPRNEDTAIYNVKIWNHIEFWSWVSQAAKN